MREYAIKAAVVAPSLIALYVVRRVVRKLYEDYRDRYRWQCLESFAYYHTTK